MTGAARQVHIPKRRRPNSWTPAALIGVLIAFAGMTVLVFPSILASGWNGDDHEARPAAGQVFYSEAVIKNPADLESQLVLARISHRIP